MRRKDTPNYSERFKQHFKINNRMMTQGSGWLVSHTHCSFSSQRTWTNTPKKGCFRKALGRRWVLSDLRSWAVFVSNWKGRIKREEQEDPGVSEPVWQEGRSHWLDEVGVGITGETGKAGGSQTLAWVKIQWKKKRLNGLSCSRESHRIWSRWMTWLNLHFKAGCTLKVKAIRFRNH